MSYLFVWRGYLMPYVYVADTTDQLKTRLSLSISYAYIMANGQTGEDFELSSGFLSNHLVYLIVEQVPTFPLIVTQYA